MVCNTYIKEKNIIFLLFYYYFCLERIKAYERNLFIYQDKNKGKEKG